MFFLFLDLAILKKIYFGLYNLIIIKKYIYQILENSLCEAAFGISSIISHIWRNMQVNNFFYRLIGK